jgi:hypothetical protein
VVLHLPGDHCITRHFERDLRGRIAEEERRARAERCERGEIAREDVEAAKQALVAAYADGCTTKLAIRRAVQRDGSLSAALTTFGEEVFRQCALLAKAEPSAARQ